MIRSWTVILCTVFSASVLAEVQFNDNRVWRRARLVNPGQQVWSFNSTYQKVNNRFGATGAIQPLGQSYARSISWKQLIDAEPTAEGKADMRDFMRQRGLGETDAAAQAAFEVEREDLTVGVDWAYGLTRNWMVGFQLPLVYRQTRVRSNVELLPSLAGAAGSANQRSMLALNGGQLREKVRGLAESQLESSGYDGIPNEQSDWNLGDISLMSQFIAMKSYRLTWALQQLVRFPTARAPSVSDYIQTSNDEGQVDVGLTSLLDYRSRRWTLGGKLGFIAQLPDSLRQRIPVENGQEVAGVDPEVRRDLGDVVWGALDSEYRVSSRLDVNLEYSVLVKGEDRFGGGAINGGNYQALERDSAQELHQTRLGMMYRLGETSARSGVENKWVASLGYSYPWLGRNSIDASRTTLELISYF